jgi:hypothetical protein
VAYNVIDLIDKSIDIEEKRKKLYESIGRGKEDYSDIKIMSRVLIKEAEKTINYYKDLKKTLVDTDLEDIDFWTYDKMSFLKNTI